MVTIYMRNASPVTGWFAIAPVSSTAPQVVGIGGANEGGLDGGVACLDAEIGNQVVQLDRSVADHGAAIAQIASVDQHATILSVDLGADGNTVIGHGVPAWWTSEPTDCRPADPGA